MWWSWRSCEVVGPAGDTAPRARGGGQAASWASRAAPPWRANRARLRRWPDRWGLATGEELDAVSDDVDARRVAAVLRLELVEQQAAVDGDLAPGIEILRTGARLSVEALDVEVAVVGLLAGALDREAQRADRGAVLGLQELRVLGEVPGAGPAVHQVLLARLSGRIVWLTRRLPAPPARTARTAVRPSPSEASGLRGVPQAPT